MREEWEGGEGGRRGREGEEEQHEGWEHQWRYMQLSNAPQAPPTTALPTHLLLFLHLVPVLHGLCLSLPLILIQLVSLQGGEGVLS